MARKSALSYKAKDKTISIVEDFNYESPKTQEYKGMLEVMSLGDKKTLLVLPANNDNIYLSSRNIKKAKVITADNLTTYDVVNADNLMLLESSIEKIDQLLTVKK